MNNEKNQDLFTRIWNSLNAKHLTVKVLNIKQYQPILNILYKEGYIKGFSFSYNNKFIKIYLKYINELPSITQIIKISTIKKRKYLSYQEISLFPQKFNHKGITIISTNKGILSHKEIKNKKLGGEVLYQIL